MSDEAHEEDCVGLKVHFHVGSIVVAPLGVMAAAAARFPGSVMAVPCFNMLGYRFQRKRILFLMVLSNAYLRN